MEEKFPLKSAPNSLKKWTPAALVGGALVGYWIAGSLFSLALGMGMVLLLVVSIKFFSFVRKSSLPVVEDPTALLVSQVRREISALAFLENLGNEGTQASELFDSTRERWKKFQSILASKFSPTEITYQRYYAQAEMAFVGMVEQLARAASLLKAVSSIDEKTLKKNLETLAESDPERQALKERIQLKATKQKEVAETLDLIQMGITKFDYLVTSLAELQLSTKSNSKELENTFQELKVLADRAKLYQP